MKSYLYRKKDKKTYKTIKLFLLIKFLLKTQLKN